MEPSQNTNQNTENQKPAKEESFLKEILKFTIITLAIFIPIRTFVAEPFIVSGASMDPTFATGQYLIVDQLTYDFRKPERLEIIIFRYPRDPKTFFIKRIIGLPGETVSVRNGKVTIINKENPKGIEIDDNFVDPANRTNENFDTTLGPTEYFVMGDNRAKSSDSRTWGPLEEKYITGRPIVRLLPISKISILPGE